MILSPKEEDEDEPLLRWSIKKQRDNKGNEEVIDPSTQVARAYSTRGSVQKWLTDSMKSSKSFTTNRKRLRKVSVVEEENIEVVGVREWEDIKFDDVAVTEKRINKVHVAERTRSSNPKPGSSTRKEKNHIIVKKKEFSKGLKPKKRKVVKNEQSSDSTRERKE